MYIHISQYNKKILSYISYIHDIVSWISIWYCKKYKSNHIRNKTDENLGTSLKLIKNYMKK